MKQILQISMNFIWATSCWALGSRAPLTVYGPEQSTKAMIEALNSLSDARVGPYGCVVDLGINEPQALITFAINDRLPCAHLTIPEMSRFLDGQPDSYQYWGGRRALVSGCATLIDLDKFLMAKCHVKKSKK